MKDLYDIFKDMDKLGNINPTDYEYLCDSCGWYGDSCNYEKIQQEYDNEGYPYSTEDNYIEKCPICNNILNF